MGANDQISSFWTTGNSLGDGDVGYTQEHLRRRDFTTWGDCVLTPADFEVTGGTDSVTVAAGASYTGGFHLDVPTPTTLSIARPTIGTTAGHVVARALWSAETVRLVAVRAADGSSTVPSVVQTAGTQWEQRLATFTITTAGVVTVKNARRMVGFHRRAITWHGQITATPTDPYIVIPGTGTSIVILHIDARVVSTAHNINAVGKVLTFADVTTSRQIQSVRFVETNKELIAGVTNTGDIILYRTGTDTWDVVLHAIWR